MFKFKSDIVDPIRFEDCKDYLLTARWQKTIIDKSGKHNYDGFTNPIKTTDGYIVNTASYLGPNSIQKKIDEQFTEILNAKTQSHFINIFPKCEVGEHFDIYDPKDSTVANPDGAYCNTSILHPLFGDIWIESDGDKTWLDQGRFTMIDTSKMHNGVNKSKKLVWCTSSLVYGKTYTEVKSILSAYIKVKSFKT